MTARALTNNIMEAANGKSCILCYTSLIGSSDCILIDKGVLEILTFLVSRLDETNLLGTSLCSSCIATLHEAYNYKTLQLEKSKQIVNNIKIKTEPNAIKKEENSNGIDMQESPAFSDVLIKQEPSEDIKVKEESKVCYICKDIADETCLPLCNILEENGINGVVGYLIPDLQGPQSAKSLVICDMCKTTLIKICEKLTMLSVYKERDPTNSDNTDLNVTVKQEPLDPNLVNFCDNQSELMEPRPGCSKEISSEYEQFKCKNEEIDLKMESEDYIEGNLDQEVSSERWCLNQKYEIPFNEKRSDIIKVEKCPFCNYHTLHKPDVYSHISEVHNNSEQIEIESKFISTKVHDCIPVLKCNLCDFQTMSESSLKSHSLAHEILEEISIQKCHLCDYKTRYWHNLKVHFFTTHKNHKEGDFHKCSECDLKTLSSSYLKVHFLLKHQSPDKIKLYKCRFCNYESRVRTNTKKHEKVHSQKPTLFCTRCQYKTKDDLNLQKHMKIHPCIEG